MNRFFLVFALGCIISLNPSFSQKNNQAYQYSIDLNKVKDDKLQVELIVPEFEFKGTADFYMPKIVPGTYSIYDFGRFITEFKAFDESGAELKVEKKNVNTWSIIDGNKLHKISYWVEDSYDSGKDTVIFEPAGTNIEEGKNYLINTFGFYGYFKELKRRPFDLSFTKPSGFYGSTPLKSLINSENKDRFISTDYYELIDSPIMFCKPDTASIMLGNTKVVVSVYSPNDELNAPEVMENASRILNAQEEYLGGNLPVDKYVLLIYCWDDMPISNMTGALEHSYSTVLSLKEDRYENLDEMITRVVAHEFFHIITPLTIHSEEIHNFDFQKPRMSKHLWLYEGMTEYAAGHVQIKEGLMPFEDYLDLLEFKLKISKSRFNDTLPFTELSLGCLDEYKSEYGNVYLKGSLIGLVLDIELRDMSQGKYGTQDLIRDLSNLYGKDKPFVDSLLFEKISELTYPEIGEFLNTYVAGSRTLPYDRYLEKIGVEYYDTLEEKEITFGGIGLGYNSDTERLVVRRTENINEFGKEIGFELDDEISKINGLEITSNNINKVLNEVKENTKPGDELSFTIVRKDKKGREKEEVKSAPAIEIIRVKKNVIKAMDEPSDAQLKLRKAWGNI